MDFGLGQQQAQIQTLPRAGGPSPARGFPGEAGPALLEQAGPVRPREGAPSFRREGAPSVALGPGSLSLFPELPPSHFFPSSLSPTRPELPLLCPCGRQPRTQLGVRGLAPGSIIKKRVNQLGPLHGPLHLLRSAMQPWPQRRHVPCWPFVFPRLLLFPGCPPELRFPVALKSAALSFFFVACLDFLSLSFSAVWLRQRPSSSVARCQPVCGMP